MKTGVLLVNLGSPKTFSKSDVKKYLHQFLMDRRVIDYPYILRALLVKALIVPRRKKKVSKLYQSIWTNDGAPLISGARKLKVELEHELGENFQVEVAMRYQTPSIQNGLELLQKGAVAKIVVLPLFPQYASATIGSIYEEVFDVIKKWETIPPLSLLGNFSDDEGFIRAFANVIIDQKDVASFDHVLFSYHGLPKRYLEKADTFQRCNTHGCCEKKCAENQHCYKANCVRTTKALSQELGIESSNYTICYQSRLGKEEWIKPYVSDVLKKLADNGMKRVLILAPSFVCDCLETTVELGEEYKEEFAKLGGVLEYATSLNNHPLWIDYLKKTTLDELRAEKKVTAILNI